MSKYNVITLDNESTVVSEYTPIKSKDGFYQTEEMLEKEFIHMLEEQGYEYVDLKNENQLIENLRNQISKLNNYTFSDDEWKRFFKEFIASSTEGIVEKTRKIQNDYIKDFICDDGHVRNLYIIKKDNIHENNLQVINQYEEERGNYKNRYDVTILVNGIPLIHIELKRRGIQLREAFNQIERYQKDSFWASSGLFEYVQIFVISNGTNTKYYSNTTRNQHIKECNKYLRNSVKKTSNSFKFTSNWADSKNKIITDLTDFTRTFFAKHTILKILTKYCVFTSEDLLLVMRPYQIVATEMILNRIELSTNYNKAGGIEAGGYVWHTTGSGKTLTSFKTAQLATKIEKIDKVLFVVDRKDLDYQTMKEYDRFEKGAANSNTSTRILKNQLENVNSKIIITTIQKLGRFISKNKTHPVFDKHIVFIFDECHRSQFGKLHISIKKSFKKYYMFGFTGTPIFATNSKPYSYDSPYQTTPQVFGEKLHTYTMADAINDKNVLPFKVDYISTVKMGENIQDEKVKSIDIERALLAPSRIKEIVSYIIEHFDQKTKRGNVYNFKNNKLNGFNSIFTVASIPMLMKYYDEFKRQLKNSSKIIRIATIFSFRANEDLEGVGFEEDFDNDRLDKGSRDFLEMAIKDYNKLFDTNFDTTSEKFQNYYKDLSLRVKNREVDILLVVNMFLTGFDATTLNTLWVDRNLKQHGLIQAFSRTNRILNSIKEFGNIVCFRNLKEQTDEAVSIFGSSESESVVILRTYKEYYLGYRNSEGKYYRGYKELITKLLTDYDLSEEIKGEDNKKNFVKLYGNILRLTNILTSFDEFIGNEILTVRQSQDYKGRYIDIYEEIKQQRENGGDKANINDDLVFELELIRQDEINLDYIMSKVTELLSGKCKEKEVLLEIIKLIDSTLELRSKKDLVMDFVSKMRGEKSSEEIKIEWENFVEDEKNRELDRIIKEQRLNEKETKEFISNSFKYGRLKTTGIILDNILPPISRFAGNKFKLENEKKVVKILTDFFNKYHGAVKKHS